MAKIVPSTPTSTNFLQCFSGQWRQGLAQFNTRPPPNTLTLTIKKDNPTMSVLC